MITYMQTLIHIVCIASAYARMHTHTYKYTYTCRLIQEQQNRAAAKKARMLEARKRFWHKLAREKEVTFCSTLNIAPCDCARNVVFQSYTLPHVIVRTDTCVCRTDETCKDAYISNFDKIRRFQKHRSIHAYLLAAQMLHIGIRISHDGCKCSTHACVHRLMLVNL
jgi:hypothetical protein